MRANTEKILVSSERRTNDEGETVWLLYIYYPAEGKVIPVYAPQTDEVILNNAL